MKISGDKISEPDGHETSLYRIFIAFLHLVTAERLVSIFQRNPCPSLSVQPALLHHHTFLVLICQGSNLYPASFPIIFDTSAKQSTLPAAHMYRHVQWANFIYSVFDPCYHMIARPYLR